MKAEAALALAADTVTLSPVARLRALAAILGLSLRQQLRGRRLLVMSLLFALPSILALVVHFGSRVAPPAESLEFALILNLIPHALAPLAALVYAAGIIQDEVEEQTLTYLLLRPLPRWALYLVKLLATLVVTSLLTGVFTAVTLATIALTTGEPLDAVLAQRALKTAVLLSLVQVGYCGLFGLLGLLTRRSLVIGVGYIVLLEGVLASLDTVARRLTVMYHFRVLALRWLDPRDGSEWSIDLTTAPEPRSCVITLLSAGLVLALAGALLFARREFRMKTPEGA